MASHGSPDLSRLMQLIEQRQQLGCVLKVRARTFRSLHSWVKFRGHLVAPNWAWHVLNAPKKIQCLVNDCWWCSEWQDQCPFHFWSNHYSSFISCWRLNDEVEANINQAHPNRWNWWKVPLLQLWKKMKKNVSSSLRLPCPCVPMVAEDIPGHLYGCLNSGGILCVFRSAHTYFTNLPQVWWLDPPVNPPVTLW